MVTRQPSGRGTGPRGALNPRRLSNLTGTPYEALAEPNDSESFMSIRRIEPGRRMSAAVVHGNTVYLAGQVGNPGEDVSKQTETVLAEIDRLLAEAGSDKSKILQATIWLADMKDFGAMNAVWDAWVDPSNPPARATGESALATPEYRVEIIVVAAI